MESVAKRQHCKPAQLALAWLLGRGEEMVPIAGLSRQAYKEGTQDSDISGKHEVKNPGAFGQPRYLGRRKYSDTRRARPELTNEVKTSRRKVFRIPE